MSIKINKWGNSHGIRLSNTILEHLNAEEGNQLEVKMTQNGIELVRKRDDLKELKQIKSQLLTDLLKKSNSVSIVSDPNQEGNCDYIVIDIDPAKPIVREVVKGYEGAFKTLAEAKKEAHQLIQTTIAESKKSLADIRQTGIEKIHYVDLN